MKLAQSKPFGLRRRCEECIPAGCRTVILRNRMFNSNRQSERMRTSANQERQLAAAGSALSTEAHLAQRVGWSGI